MKFEQQQDRLIHKSVFSLFGLDYFSGLGYT